jgi:hypothetical protein
MPARPTGIPRWPGYLKYNGGEPHFDRITDLQVDLLAQALACDLTRFGTLNDPGQQMGELPPNCHDNVAHLYSSRDPASTVKLARMNQYSYGKCARLMQRLQEMGVLDQTLIYMASDMGDPNAHAVRNVPMILAGGAGGYFKMGRHIKVAAEGPNNEEWCNTRKVVGHNGILVSIANAFGVPVDRYGTAADPSSIAGAFPGLR